MMRQSSLRARIALLSLAGWPVAGAAQQPAPASRPAVPTPAPAAPGGSFFNQLGLYAELSVHIADPEVARQQAQERLAKAASHRERLVEERALGRLNSIRRPQQIRLTLADCIARALANNYAIRTESYGPAIDRTRLVEAEAQFDPSFFSNFTSNLQDRPSSAAQLTGTATNLRNYSAGIRKLLATGAQVQASYSHRRNESNLSFQTLNPSYFNNFIIDFRQPLLRGFGLDVNRSQIELRKLDQKVSMLDFRQQIRETLNNVEQIYWRLLQARRDVTIEAALLLRFEDLLSTLVDRLQFDAKITDVQLTRARVENRIAAFVDTRNRVKSAEDRLKSLLNDPDLTLTDDVEIIPIDPVTEEGRVLRHSIYVVMAQRRARLLELDRQQAEEFKSTEDEPARPDEQRLAVIRRQRAEIEAQYRTDLHAIMLAEVQAGLDNREELKSARLQIKSAHVLVGLAKNQALPRFDLTVRYTANGLGANADLAFRQLNNYDFEEWFIGVEFEWPIGNRAARAALRRARLRDFQAQAAAKNVIEDVYLDISLALRDLETAFDQVAPSLEGVRAGLANVNTIKVRAEARSPGQLEAEQGAFDALATSRQSLLRALVNYNIAISSLERAKGTLLEYNNVTLTD